MPRFEIDRRFAASRTVACATLAGLALSSATIVAALLALLHGAPGLVAPLVSGAAAGVAILAVAVALARAERPPAR